MNKYEQLWNEYNSLRNEILQADLKNYQILGIVVAAAALVISTGIRQIDPLYRLLCLLCVYIITVPSYELLKSNRIQIWRISTYTRVFIEPQFEYINWETRLDKQRAKSVSNKHF